MNDRSRTKTMNITAIILTIIFTFLILFFVFRMISKTTKFDYAINNKGIIITMGKGINISYDDIKEIQYLDKVPKLSKRNGTDFKNIRSGIFNVDGIGRGYVYAKDVTKPAVIIHTKDTFYLLTPDNAETFKMSIEKKLAQK